jgi:DNA-binding NtrC family response regulator
MRPSRAGSGEAPMAREMFPAIVLCMTAKYLSQFTDSGCDPLKHQTIPRQRILVVEDQYDLRQITAEVLIDAGYQVDVAEDGAAAWTALQLNQYGLLITDQFIPKGSDLELLRKIHAARMTLPIIMATGLLLIQEFALQPFLRTTNLIFKPYSFEKLLSMVNMVLLITTNASDVRPLPPMPPEASLPPLIAREFATLKR